MFVLNLWNFLKERIKCCFRNNVALSLIGPEACGWGVQNAGGVASAMTSPSLVPSRCAEQPEDDRAGGERRGPHAAPSISLDCSKYVFCHFRHERWVGLRPRLSAVGVSVCSCVAARLFEPRGWLLTAEPRSATPRLFWESDFKGECDVRRCVSDVNVLEVFLRPGWFQYALKFSESSFLSSCFGCDREISPTSDLFCAPLKWQTKHLC